MKEQENRPYKMQVENVLVEDLRAHFIEQVKAIFSEKRRTKQ